MIWKFGPIMNYADTEVRGRIVHVDSQDGKFYVWADQSPPYNQEFSEVRFVPTGVAFPPTYEYVGTIKQADYFMWHIIRKKF